MRTTYSGTSGGEIYGGDFFGYSVAIDGNRIIVGTPEDKIDNDGLSARKGSASIYDGSSPPVKIRGTELGSRFGTSVGISSDRVIIGAPQHHDDLDPPYEFRGAAYIYMGPSGWVRQGQLDIDTGTNVSSFFGNSVAIDGDNAVVGASSIGRAYVSRFETSLWTKPVVLTYGSGYSVSLDSDLLVVGSPSTVRGTAYVYRLINDDCVPKETCWTYKAQLFQKDVPAGTTDCFGVSVAVDGNRIIGGAACDGIAPSTTGKASIFVNVSPRPFDFNGGGVSDLSVVRPSTSDWFSMDPISGGSLVIPFGTSGDKIASAEFDGDGKSDIAVFRPSEGRWFILKSSTSQVSEISFGQTGDVPRPNDFDNDGKADVAIFRPSTSTWWWINSSNQQANAVQFGQSGDVPLMADFDGDARGELAVFRPASRTFIWFNLTTSHTGTQVFGQSDDIPTPGDFDGDSKTDIAVFRPSTSGWYRINSSNGQGVLTPFGITGDIPVVADYDEDGESDIAVFRPSDRVWYIINSSFNDIPLTPQYTFIPFGASGDVPVPAAYLR